MPRKYQPNDKLDDASWQEADLARKFEQDVSEEHSDLYNFLDDVYSALKVDAAGRLDNSQIEMIDQFNKNPSASQAIDIAEAFMAAGSYSNATFYFEKAIRADRKSEVAISKKAEIFENRGDFVESIMIYNFLINCGGDANKQYYLDKSAFLDLKIDMESNKFKFYNSKMEKIIDRIKIEAVKPEDVRSASVAALLFVDKNCKEAPEPSKHLAAELITIIVKMTVANNDAQLRSAYKRLKDELSGVIDDPERLSPIDREAFIVVANSFIWTPTSGLKPSEHIVAHFSKWLDGRLTIEDIKDVQPNLVAEYKAEIMRNPRRRIRSLTKPHKLPPGMTQGMQKAVGRVAELSPEELEHRRSQERAKKARYRLKHLRP